MWGLRRHIFLICLVGLMLSPFGDAESETLSPRKQLKKSVAVASRYLSNHSTFRAIETYLGSYPDNCEQATLTTEVCLWELGDQDSAWNLLAEGIEATGQIGLICEFPTDESERDPGSCSVHPRVSNRDYFYFSVRRSDPKRLILAKRYKEYAISLLAGARTISQLSALVGDVPQCYPRADFFYCRWKADRRTYGHGTLAQSIDAPFRKRVKLICKLPSSGEPRDPKSCQVRIDGT